MSNVVPFDQPSTGRPSWHIIPVAARDKRPLTPHGVKDASRDPAVISRWWQRWPDANTGAAMGSTAGVWCLDVDPRNGGGISLDILQDQTGPWPVTWRSATGGGGQHFFFRLAPGVVIPNGTPLPGIDVISDGKYVILPPSTHPSGRPYQWYVDEGPDDVELAYAPAALLERLQAARPAPLAPLAALLTPPRVQEIRSALAFIPTDDRDQWLHAGMALHAEAPTEQGFGLWAEWSQASEKYDAKDQARVWRSFKGSTNALTIASLFQGAYARGWPGAPALEAPAAIIRSAPARATLQAPAELLAIPGTLNDLVRYDLMTAPRPNPQLAVQGAIAFGCAVLARRFVTDSRNHAALFLLSIAQAGTGKEHAKRTVERTLQAADLQHLLGGAGYSSATALFSRLQSTPAHLAIIDEYGRMLESGRRSMSEHKLTAITALMETYGRTDGVLMPTNFSTRGLTPRERRDVDGARIFCPNVSMLTMSTPDAFYATLSDRSVQDGFLPRFIVVESDSRRQATADFIQAEPPDTVIAWAQHLRTRSLPPGNIAAARADEADAQPHLVLVPFSTAARRLLAELEQRVLDRQDQIEREGMAELFGRTRENAMRLSLIVALSRDPNTSDVSAADVRWSSSYVEYYAEQTLHNVRNRLVGSEFGSWTAKARQLVESAGEKGITARELCRYSSKLRDLTDRQFNDVMAALVRAGHCALVKVATPSGRGKPRQAWVLADLLQEAEEAA